MQAAGVDVDGSNEDADYSAADGGLELLDQLEPEFRLALAQ